MWRLAQREKCKTGRQGGGSCVDLEGARLKKQEHASNAIGRKKPGQKGRPRTPAV